VNVGCGGSQTGTNDYVYSHNDYHSEPPTNYGNNKLCNYNIETNQGFSILMAFHHFDIEASADCTKDYVLVQEVKPDGGRTDLGNLRKHKTRKQRCCCERW